MSELIPSRFSIRALKSEPCFELPEARNRGVRRLKPSVCAARAKAIRLLAFPPACYWGGRRPQPDELWPWAKEAIIPGGKARHPEADRVPKPVAASGGGCAALGRVRDPRVEQSCHPVPYQFALPRNAGHGSPAASNRVVYARMPLAASTHAEAVAPTSPVRGAQLRPEELRGPTGVPDLQHGFLHEMISSTQQEYSGWTGVWSYGSGLHLSLPACEWAAREFTQRRCCCRYATHGKRWPWAFLAVNPPGNLVVARPRRQPLPADGKKLASNELIPRSQVSGKRLAETRRGVEMPATAQPLPSAAFWRQPRHWGSFVGLVPA